MAYYLKSVQRLPITVEEAWAFFSTPLNLDAITPRDMSFVLTSGNGDEKIHAGQILTYRIAPIARIPLRWMTEITHVVHHEYFVDEQREGPYKMWHHKHAFKAIEGGVEMTDELWYIPPFGFIGRIAQWLFVGKKVKSIFDYRYRILEERFGKFPQQ